MSTSTAPRRAASSACLGPTRSSRRRVAATMSLMVVRLPSDNSPSLPVPHRSAASGRSRHPSTERGSTNRIGPQIDRSRDALGDEVTPAARHEEEPAQIASCRSDDASAQAFLAAGVLASRRCARPSGGGTTDGPSRVPSGAWRCRRRSRVDCRCDRPEMRSSRRWCWWRSWDLFGAPKPTGPHGDARAACRASPQAGGYLPTVITEWSGGGAPSPWGAKSIVWVPRESGLIRAAYPNPPKLIVPPPGSPKMLFSGHGTVV
jgi:hypothetical protein